MDPSLRWDDTVLSGRDSALKATAAELKQDAELYASKTLGREPRFVKRPINWLSNACWQEADAGAPPDYNSRQAPPKSSSSGIDKMIDDILARDAVGAP